MQSSASKNKAFSVNIYPSRRKSGALILTVSLMLMALSTPACRKTETIKNFPQRNQLKISPAAVNLNTASAAELEKLTGVGTETARRIVAFRERHGNFRRAENLILVDGMSDQKFREIKHLVKVE